MAHMYPQQFPATAIERRRANSEQYIYDLLSKLPDTFTVFYSVHWLAKRRKSGARDGETDFVIVHPKFGVLLIEVKGGAVKHHESGQWTSRNAEGVYNIRNPFDQLRDGIFTLRDKIEISPATKQFRYPLSRGVWFTSSFKKHDDLGPDVPRDIVLDSRDAAAPLEGIMRLYNYCQGIDAPGACRGLQTRGSRDFGPDAVNALTKLLAPTYEIPALLAAEFIVENQVIRQLTEEQFTVLDELAQHRRMCITGCAGSGKTFLAVEKARRLAIDEGYHVLLTCYNRELADFIGEHLGKVANVTVSTFTDLCEALVREAGSGNRILRGAKDDHYYAHTLPNAAVDASDKVKQRFDAIIVDEGQDFKPTWWEPLQLTLSDPDDGILYIFYDDNQTLYGGDKGYQDAVKHFPVDHQPYQLTINCRNTQEIHNTMREYYQGTHQITCQGVPGRRVEIETTNSDERSARSAMRKVVASLAKQAVPPSDIVILTPVERDSLWQDGDKLGNWTIERSAVASEPNRIACCTIHSFKGLERSVVIVTELEKMGGDRDILRYVAFSRACNHLIVLQTR